MKTTDFPWNDIYLEAQEIFCSLLRINTVNPPGNEVAAIEFLKDRLEKEGIDCQVYEPAKDRANLVARVKGGGSDRPLLLSGHVDVVPFEADKWQHHPLSGDIADGYIWGRGAIDMKNMVAMSAMALILTKRHGLNLKRDLIFCALADEEAGCEWGSKYLTENHAEALQSEYMLSEIGGFTLHIGDKRFYPIQVAEKGVCWFKVIAEGEPGHGSMMVDNNAIARIGEVAAKLQQARLPLHITKTVEHFVGEMAKHQPFPNSVVLSQVLNPFLSDIIVNNILPGNLQKTFYALLHNTANPTMLRGGEKINVVPAGAELQVDGRVIPGISQSEYLQEIRSVIGEGSKIEVMQFLDGHEGSYADPIFDVFREVIDSNDKDAIVIPSMVPGFTDAKYFNRLGIKCYGFSPVKLQPDDVFGSLFHGHNERIPVEGFNFGVKALMEVVERLCGMNSVE